MDTAMRNHVQPVLHAAFFLYRCLHHQVFGVRVFENHIDPEDIPGHLEREFLHHCSLLGVITIDYSQEWRFLTLPLDDRAPIRLIEQYFSRPLYSIAKKLFGRSFGGSSPHFDDSPSSLHTIEWSILHVTADNENDHKPGIYAEISREVHIDADVSYWDHDPYVFVMGHLSLQLYGELRLTSKSRHLISEYHRGDPEPLEEFLGRYIRRLFLVLLSKNR